MRLVELQRAMQMDSSSAMVNRAMAATYIQLGRDDDAFRAIHRWLEGSYPGEIPARATLAYRQGGIKATLRLLVGGFEARRKAGLYEPATHLAELYSLLGDRQEALRWLEIALRERDTQLNRLKVDPIFDPLRQEPRFQEVARQVGLSIAA
jgi:tetratricopeptide (TPR) repeat protein